jgi:signal transduction histidine kinase
LRKPIEIGDLISVISRQTQKAAGTSPREDTDESLRKERQKSDREVDRRSEGAAGVADAVIEQARDDADEVLRAAREAGQPSPGPLETQARVEEDATIQRQRAAADLKLGNETRERTRALAALFALERELTDQHLLAERNRADVALNNRDDFLGMVAHDLRGFMAEIAYRAAMLARDPRDDEAGRRSRQMGEGIQRSTAGMKRLVSDLVDIAAIEAGRLHVEARSGDVASVLRDAGEPFRFAAEAKGIALELEELPHSALALFDHDRVVQVLGNLVSNAIKFTPEGGRISILLDVASNEVRVTVADTGAGIPPDKLEAIFERFTQLRADRRGLGLGLYISRYLVEAQRGRIWATSVPGAGSKLSFTLPLAR